MKPIASIVGLLVLFGFIELSNSWRLRGMFNRVLWIVLLVAAGAWCVSTLLDLGWM